MRWVARSYIFEKMVNNMTEQKKPHITFAQALASEATYNQDYQTVVVWAGEVKDVNVEGQTKKVQDLKLDDGTATIRFSVWGGGQIKEGAGCELSNAYIKKNGEGYYGIKVAGPAKGGSMKFTPTSTIIPSKPTLDTQTSPNPISHPTGNSAWDGAFRKTMKSIFDLLWDDSTPKLQETLMAKFSADMPKIQEFLGGS
jgi:hypothetical protein